MLMYGDIRSMLEKGLSSLMLAVLICSSIGIQAIPTLVHAARIDDIRVQISERNREIKRLEQDIEVYQGELRTLGQEKRTLQGAVRNFDVSIKKVTTDITLTESRIDATELTLEQLGLEIADKQARIGRNALAVASAIRSIHEAESASFLEVLLSHTQFSDVWERVESLQRFQRTVQRDTVMLQDLKSELAKTRQEAQQRKQSLLGLKSDLNDKRSIVAYQREEKNKLLKTTKNKETNYENLLEERLEQKKQFEQELLKLESELKFEIDPNSVPAPLPGILTWPLDDVRITQYFGNTAFARANAQVYKGTGHNGIDFGAPRGTTIRAALGGVVVGTGNTDAIRGCYSFGKWVMVRHNNGLSTLYAHLSLIKVAEGQTVNTGSVLGFSGNTGYSTGPHLHFGVYATQGVRIQKFTRSINCKNAVIPVADLRAYLNPISYLPAL